MASISRGITLPSLVLKRSPRVVVHNCHVNVAFQSIARKRLTTSSRCFAKPGSITLKRAQQLTGQHYKTRPNTIPSSVRSKESLNRPSIFRKPRSSPPEAPLQVPQEIQSENQSAALSETPTVISNEAMPTETLYDSTSQDSIQQTDFKKLPITERRTFPWQIGIQSDNNIIQEPPSLQVVSRKLATGSKVDIYQEPGDTWATTTVSVVWTGFWAIVGINSFVYLAELTAHGIDQSFMVLASSFLVGIAATIAGSLGYLVRLNAVKKISLIPSKTHGSKAVYAKIQYKGWIPFTTSTRLVPSSQTRVTKTWDEIMPPTFDTYLELRKANWFTRIFVKIKAIFLTIMYTVRFRLAGQSMVHMYTNPQDRGFSKALLVDGIGLEPIYKGAPSPANNSDVFYEYIRAAR